MLYFIRHGQSTYNLEHLVTGTTDVELTDLGREQALHAAEIVRLLDVTHVVSSDLRRAKQTAQIIMDHLDLQVEYEIWPEFHEVNYGTCQGKFVPGGCRTYLEIVSQGLCSESETIEGVYARATGIVKKLKTLPTNANYLFVGHGTFTAMVFAVWEGLEPKGLLDYRLKWEFENAEVKKLE